MTKKAYYNGLTKLDSVLIILQQREKRRQLHYIHFEVGVYFYLLTGVLIFFLSAICT